MNVIYTKLYLTTDATTLTTSTEDIIFTEDIISTEIIFSVTLIVWKDICLNL